MCECLFVFGDFSCYIKIESSFQRVNDTMRTSQSDMACSLSIYIMLIFVQMRAEEKKQQLTTNFDTFAAVDVANWFHMSLDCWPGY